MAAQDGHHQLEWFSLPWHLLRNCIKSPSNQLIGVIEGSAPESFSDEALAMKMKPLPTGLNRRLVAGSRRQPQAATCHEASTKLAQLRLPSLGTTTRLSKQTPRGQHSGLCCEVGGQELHAVNSFSRSFTLGNRWLFSLCTCRWVSASSSARPAINAWVEAQVSGGTW